MIRQRAGKIKSVIAPTEDAAYSVEIHPTLVDAGNTGELSTPGSNRVHRRIQLAGFLPWVKGN